MNKKKLFSFSVAFFHSFIIIITLDNYFSQHGREQTLVLQRLWRKVAVELARFFRWKKKEKTTKRWFSDGESPRIGFPRPVSPLGRREQKMFFAMILMIVVGSAAAAAAADVIGVAVALRSCWRKTISTIAFGQWRTHCDQQNGRSCPPGLEI